MIQAISIKQLREEFPFVRQQIAKGVKFILIYRSTPIAEIKPLNAVASKVKLSALQAFAKPPRRLLFESKRSAVDLVRRERK